MDIETVQGSFLGPTVYALFPRPLNDLEKLTTIFADDNFILSSDMEKKIIKWLKDSGLRVNET